MSFPKYERYKDSGVEWLGEIPEHWEVKRIKHLCFVNPSGNRAKSDEVVTFLPMEAVSTNGGYDESNVNTRSAFSNSLTEFQEGDIIIAKITPCFENGKVAYLRKLPTQKGVGSTEFHVFRINEENVLKDFFYYFISSENLKRYSTVFMEGAAGQKRVTTAFVANLHCSLPPLEEQRQIAEFLDRKSGEIEDAIAHKKRLIELLEEQKTILINQAVTKGLKTDAPMKDSGIEWLGEIPANWEVKRLKRLFTEVDDRSVDGSETLFSLRMYQGLVPHNDVSDKVILDKDLIGYKRVRSGQVVMNRMRAATGLFGLAQDLGIVSPDYAIFKPISSLEPVYYLHLFKTESLKDIFRLESKGLGTGSSGFLRLYSDKFGMIKVPFPSIEEQKEIVSYIQDINKRSFQVITQIQQQIEKLTELKQILIAEAVTGKIKI